MANVSKSDGNENVRSRAEGTLQPGAAPLPLIRCETLEEVRSVYGDEACAETDQQRRASSTEVSVNEALRLALAAKQQAAKARTLRVLDAEISCEPDGDGWD